MATRRDSLEFQTGVHRFPSVLVYAVLEWLLIFLLFLDALLSYLITKFASSSKLQPPCLLCSRLDHIIGSAKPGFYRELICRTHLLEISSLFYCHTHEKLSDVRGMCEHCLRSFAAENKLNSKNYILPVEKLGIELESHSEGDHRILNCSCCDEPFKSRSCLHGLLQTRSIGTDGFENEIEKMTTLRTFSHIGNHGFDSLAHVGYTQLNISSDSDSEVPMSDEECGSVHLLGETNDFKVELSNQSVSEFGGFNVKILPETILVDTSPEEPNLQATSSPDTLAPFDLISADSVPSSAKIVDALVDESEDKCITEISKTENSDGETAQNSINDNGEIFKPANKLIPNRSGLKMNEIIDDPSSSMPKSMDLNDAYTLAVGNKGSQQSDIFAELVGRDSTKIHEDLKLLLSHLSASRGIDLPLLDTGSKMHGYGDDFKVSNSPSPIGLQILNKRISIERNLSGLSMDGSIASEIEGESVVDRLKRQIEFDRKNMGALYKELEEERNASTIAATQAMAMITRLQEEKAAMQMEALQYQRMMEEQSEYDQEAFQQANELLAQREKELQDMEAELVSYRKRFQQESELEEGIMLSNHDDFSYNSPIIVKSKHSCVSHSFRSQEESVNDVTEKADGQQIGNSMGDMKDPQLEFENEKLYISERLKNLEKKLHLFSNNGISGCIRCLDGNRGDDSSDKNSEDTVLCGFPLKQDQTLLVENANGNPSANMGGFLPSTGGMQFSNEQSHNHNSQYSKIVRETELISIENEVLDLNRDVQLRTEGFPFAIDTLELLDTGTSFALRKNCSSPGKMRTAVIPELHGLRHYSKCTEEGDGNLSCLLNLTLSSSPLQVQRSDYMARVASSLGHDKDSTTELRSCARDNEANLKAITRGISSAEDANMSSEEVPSSIQASVPTVGRVNDLFWEQFLTERPGLSDTEEASSSFRENPCDEQEERKPGITKSWNKQNVEQLKL